MAVTTALACSSHQKAQGTRLLYGFRPGRTKLLRDGSNLVIFFPSLFQVLAKCLFSHSPSPRWGRQSIKCSTIQILSQLINILHNNILPTSGLDSGHFYQYFHHMQPPMMDIPKVSFIAQPLRMNFSLTMVAVRYNGIKYLIHRITYQSFYNNIQPNMDISHILYIGRDTTRFVIEILTFE